MAKTKRPPRTQAARIKKTQQYVVLSKAIALVAKSGPTKPEMEQMLSYALRDATFKAEKDPSWHTADMDLVYAQAAVLQAWHTHRRLLDDAAKPIPIPLLGSYPSVEAIIRRAYPKTNASDLAKEIYKRGYAKRLDKNRYLPIDRTAHVTGSNPLYLIRACYLVARFLETIEHNMITADVNEKIVERAAHVETLPREKLRGFMDISRQQSTALTYVMDNWLGSNSQPRRSRSRKGSVAAAGLVVFAFSCKPT